jgi:predicted nucleotidyltransferase
MDLDLTRLPALPQSSTIRWLAPCLWQRHGVVAVWLGGSLASGAGDQYSDIDLRVAVAPEDLRDWEAPDLSALFDDQVLGRRFIRFGEDAFLHHFILRNGDILDFLVQSAARTPSAERILILGCRDEALAVRLAASDREPPDPHRPVDPNAVRELLIAFWIDSHKHRKVLHRNLDLMFPAAVYVSWPMLMRLWHISATGEDTDPVHFSGIHGLTALVRAVESAAGHDALAELGMPTRNRAEMCAAIERQRAIVARVGRTLARRYEFAYPSDLEEMVLRAWDQFLAEHGAQLP